MKMRQFFLIASFFYVTLTTAQNISVKSVNYRMSDLKASTEQRMDGTGKPCAIVRVGVVGVKDLLFPDAVGDVAYSLGEYIVYVPDGLQKLNYKNSTGKVSGSIAFDDYGLEIETKKVYSVVFESENHIRAAIFSVQPTTAQLTFNGKPLQLDKDGLAIAEMPIGEYAYKVEAQGFLSQSGTVQLIEDDISSTVTVSLEQKQYPLTIKCQPANATLFIDNTPYGSLSELKDLKLPDGEHHVRLTAVGYNDYEQSIHVSGKPSTLTVNMVQMKEKVVEHKYERTRTHINIRPGFYTTIGGELYDKNQYLGHDWGLRLSFGAMQHFAGIFSVYEGIGGGISNLTDSGKDTYFEHAADSANTYFVEIPLLIGVSVPFGKFNKNLFSILGGGYGRMLLTEIVDEQSTKAADEHGNSSKTNWDFGLRVMATLDISRFSISADVSLSLAKFKKFEKDTNAATLPKTKENNKPNLFFGVTVGAKLGKL